MVESAEIVTEMFYPDRGGAYGPSKNGKLGSGSMRRGPRRKSLRKTKGLIFCTPSGKSENEGDGSRTRSAERRYWSIFSLP